jgi:hypothetical protein
MDRQRQRRQQQATSSFDRATESIASSRWQLQICLKGYIKHPNLGRSITIPSKRCTFPFITTSLQVHPNPLALTITVFQYAHSDCSHHPSSGQQARQAYRQERRLGHRFRGRPTGSSRKARKGATTTTSMVWL